MNVGVVFPQNEIGNDPAVIRDFVQYAEASGYTHLRVYDHVLGAVHEDREPKLTGPYDETFAFHEPFVLLGHLAAVTNAIELVTGVIILPQRQTALLAKQAAEVDLLSGGRLRLGVGTGWNYVEYEALNEDFSNRGARQEEQIEVLRQLWDADLVDYRGRWHRIDRASLLPRPERRIPIWLGGFADTVLRRAARLADGFLFARPHDIVEDALGRLRPYLEAEGRDPAAFGVDALVHMSAGKEHWADEAVAFRDLGATHLTVNTMGQGLRGAEHIGALTPYLDTVRTALTER